MTIELKVNWIRCDGYGLCGDILPELIDLDDWRYPIIRRGSIPDRLLDGARRAVDVCPMKALRLESSAVVVQRPAATSGRRPGG